MNRPHLSVGFVGRTVVASLIAAGLAAPAGAQQHNLVSRAADGTIGNGASMNGMISADSSTVAFASAASNLIAGDTNSVWDVFVKNLTTHVVTRVSVATDGSERNASSGFDGLDLSGDGQVVVFATMATFAPDDTDACSTDENVIDPCSDIYVRDRLANTTTRISVGFNGQQANNRSWRPRISDDGRFVVFSSLASNLVPGDTNNAEDIFLHDRQTSTTTRISVTSDGVQAQGQSTRAEISGNGAKIVFLSGATGLSSDPDPLQCFTPGPIPCYRAYVYDRARQTTTALRVAPSPNSNPFERQVGDVSIDAEGRFVAIGISSPAGPGDGRFERFWVVTYDLARRQIVRTLGPVVRNGSFPTAPVGAAISGNGHVSILNGGLFTLLVTSQIVRYGVFDRGTGLYEAPEPLPFYSPLTFPDPELSFDGRLAIFTDRHRSPEDTNAVDDVYIFNRDVDNDGIVDTWETQWGLDPANPADAVLDPDNDGRTNLQEYQDGSHPKATQTRYFAEGASNAFFSTRMALFNPTDTEATAVLRLLGSEGVNASILKTIPARTRLTLDLGPGGADAAIVPANDFSTVIESDQPLVADRTMTWDASRYGAHAETSIPSPSLNWFLAEGATNGSFDLFYLLQNPNPTEVTVTINYLRPSPLPVVTRIYTVPANSRRTIWVDDEGPELAVAEVSAEIIATDPIIVERAMYYGTARQVPFVAGHAGAGVTAASNTWFLAEGATGGVFDEYVLIANPGPVDTVATVSYLLTTGERFSLPYPVPGRSRRTISIEQEDPRLAGAEVSVIVESPQPIVVERAMWWPSPVWYEGHLAVGSTTTGTRWALAEGEIGVAAGTTADTATYILIANTGSAAGSATVTLYHEGSVTPSQITVPMAANSRATVDVAGMFPASQFGPTRRFSAIIESTGIPIVVERAMYTTVNSVFWSTGTSSLGTKLQ